jgi:hypothetical protein
LECKDEYSVPLKNAGGTSWESFQKNRSLLALKAVSSWSKIEDLYIQFDLIHKEEWYLNKMRILKEEKSPF